MKIINPWSYEYIRRLTDEATERAKEQSLRPALGKEVVATYKSSRRFNIPFLGDYTPDGWTRVDHLIRPIFVDTTGRGQPGDPAITSFEFFKRAETQLQTESSVVLAYGVIEQGQTQALVATYKRT
jgi:hypothetical protein